MDISPDLSSKLREYELCNLEIDSLLAMPRDGSTRKRDVQARNRPIKACMECRRRKAKCDKQTPCSTCVDNQRQCLYVPQALAPEDLAKLNQLKRRNRDLESALEQQVAKPANKPKTRKRTYGQDDTDDSDSDDSTDKLQPTKFAVAAAAYKHDEADNDDDVLGIGLRIGKVQLTDRIGGYFRPRMADEVGAHSQSTMLTILSMQALIFCS